jgi:hypothetical protein
MPSLSSFHVLIADASSARSLIETVMAILCLWLDDGRFYTELAVERGESEKWCRLTSRSSNNSSSDDSEQYIPDLLDSRSFVMIRAVEIVLMDGDEDGPILPDPPRMCRRMVSRSRILPAISSSRVAGFESDV